LHIKCVDKTGPSRKGGHGVFGEKRSRLAGLIIGVSTLMATPAFARSISLKNTGLAFWIFVIVGTIIVLLQLIPAIILFFSFVGGMTNLSQRSRLQKK
jgi:lipoprotein signal peptidase